VLKQISPVVVPFFPNALPWKTLPSCKIKIAGWGEYVSDMYIVLQRKENQIK
jgi:hypothetical protein